MICPHSYSGEHSFEKISKKILRCVHCGKKTAMKFAR